jgi:uncharacterized caspase-like protein
MRALAAVLLIICSIPLFGSVARAEKRVALVVGNSTYQYANRLTNPGNDSDAMASAFKGAGFDVVELRQNLGVREMRRALRDFSDSVRGADIAIVYFAGHGIEIDGTNYIIPVDAVMERDIDAFDEAIPLERILTVIEPARQLRLVILDACRDNPFNKSMKRTIGARALVRGLAKVEPTGPNTLVAFAAKAGSTASDGDTVNSPFTAALVKFLTRPGLDLRKAFGFARDEVLKVTSNRQEPFIYGSLGGEDFALVPAAVTAPPVAAQSDPNAATRRDYELAEKIGTRAVWDSFINAYPSGFYTDIAKAQRNKLLAESTVEEQQRLAAEGARQAEQARAAGRAEAAEQARIAAEKRKAIEEAKAAEEARAAERSRKAEAARLEQQRSAAEKKQAEEARAKAEEDARIAAKTKAEAAKAEQQRLAAEKKQADEARAKAEEGARIAAKAKAEAAKVEQQRLAAEKKQADEARAKAEEDARIAAAKAKAEAAKAEAAAKAAADLAKTAEQKKGEGEKPVGQLAALAPPGEAGAAKPDQRAAGDVPRLLQTELRRVGCYSGTVDGNWNAASQKSLGLFNKNARTKFDVNLASLDALDIVRGKTGRVCPPVCDYGYKLDGDGCTKIICKPGFELGDDNSCERIEVKRPERPAAQPAPEAERPQAPKPPRMSQSGSGLTACSIYCKQKYGGAMPHQESRCMAFAGRCDHSR